MDAAYGHAIQAINQGMAHFQQAAQRVSAGPGQAGFVEAVVEMKQAELEVAAAVEVFRTVDDTLGQLVDLMA